MSFQGIFVIGLSFGVYPIENAFGDFGDFGGGGGRGTVTGSDGCWLVYTHTFLSK